MNNKPTNRIKVILAERKKTNLWLASKLGVDSSIVSKWCSNSNLSTKSHSTGGVGRRQAGCQAPASGFSDVEDCVYRKSDELPIMKRRLADVTARYKDLDIVFELVTPTTHIARVHDRDIFYLINYWQVFWIFGLESIVDYNELRRSVSKDIFFTNKRNVFVFDLETQEESKRRGELMLKCNWLHNIHCFPIALSVHPKARRTRSKLKSLFHDSFFLFEFGGYRK